MVEEYLLSEKDEQRLVEIVEELTKSSYARMVTGYDTHERASSPLDEKKLEEIAKDVDDGGSPAKVYEKYYRTSELVPRLIYAFDSFLLVADILRLSEIMGDSFTLLDETTSEEASKVIQKLPAYLRLASKTEKEEAKIKRTSEYAKSGLREAGEERFRMMIRGEGLNPPENLGPLPLAILRKEGNSNSILLAVHKGSNDCPDVYFCDDKTLFRINYAPMFYDITYGNGMEGDEHSPEPPYCIVPN